MVVDLEYAFPFEGNGNTYIEAGATAALDLEYAFPFEGNGNFSYDTACSVAFSVTWNTLSRLKGMET